MDNPEALSTLNTQDIGEINIRENRMGNQEWTNQRNWQHWVHTTKKSKQKYNTICVGHNYGQAKTNNVSKV